MCQLHSWIQNELDKLHLHEWQRINHFPNHQEASHGSAACGGGAAAAAELLVP
jgi:hypothetical protein